jgi:hypothetical protein
MSDSTKMNEVFIKSILDNYSKEEAIRRIVEAMTNRDTIIRKLKDRVPA